MSGLGESDRRTESGDAVEPRHLAHDVAQRHAHSPGESENRSLSLYHLLVWPHLQLGLESRELVGAAPIADRGSAKTQCQERTDAEVGTQVEILLIALVGVGQRRREGALGNRVRWREEDGPLAAGRERDRKSR